ncbi:MAG: glycosyltransferase family 4 protein [Pseudomonadota bacterium]
MRISFVLPHAGTAGGIRVVAAYAERLQRRGHEIFVVSTPFPSRGLRGTARTLAQGRWPKRPPEDAPYLDPLPIEHRVLESVRPVTDADMPDADAVVATWWETAFAVADLSPSKGTKFHFVQHHEVFEDQPRHLVAGSYYLPLHRITITEWLRDTMAERYGDLNVDLVPNSVDTSVFKAVVRGRRTPPTVGFIHSATAFKDAATALAAIAQLRETLPEVKVLAFGHDVPSGALALPSGATFITSPTQAEIPGLYAACDVFLMTSRCEGFGLPVLEAMACGTPVVATATGCAPEMLGDGEAGRVVPVGDASAVAAAVIELLEQPEASWRAMSSAASKRVRDYTWDDATTLFEAALQRRL